MSRPTSAPIPEPRRDDEAPLDWPDATPALRALEYRPLAAVCAEITAEPRSTSSLTIKRIIDIVGSTAALVAFSPVFLVLAILVRATSHGPALFVQDRCGKGGRVFRFYKFRTMVVDAEARKAELEHLNEMSGPIFKIQRDPRVTRLGAFLRKFSLDELPQFWNVLKGDMSLVGPRPPLPSEVEYYTSRQAQRLSVMPGLTGLWQISGRSTISNFETWIDLDLQYVQQWSLWLDLRILVKTPTSVIFGRGAH